jgi:hypothetical protein
MGMPFWLAKTFHTLAKSWMKLMKVAGPLVCLKGMTV